MNHVWINMKLRKTMHLLGNFFYVDRITILECLTNVYICKISDLNNLQYFYWKSKFGNASGQTKHFSKIAKAKVQIFKWQNTNLRKQDLETMYSISYRVSLFFKPNIWSRKLRVEVDPFNPFMTEVPTI